MLSFLSNMIFSLVSTPSCRQEQLVIHRKTRSHLIPGLLSYLYQIIFKVLNLKQHA